MKRSAWLPNENRPPASEHTGWHAIAAFGLLFLLCLSASCGEEDFSVGGPLPTRPPAGTGSPAPTPTEDF